MLNMLNDDEPRVNMSFSSFEKVEEYMNNYMDKCNQMFIKRQSLQEGPNCRIKKKLANGIKYHYVEYVCKHGKRKHPSTQIKKRR